MSNCKNCGSTAQFKKVRMHYIEAEAEARQGLLEVYKCQGCGYTENVCYVFDSAEGRTADNTLIYTDRRNTLEDLACAFRAVPEPELIRRNKEFDEL